VTSSNQPKIKKQKEPQAEQKIGRQDQKTQSRGNQKDRVVIGVGWLLAILFVVAALYLGWKFRYDSPVLAILNNGKDS
jgi:type VI protein secretion system component VasF